MADKDAPVTLRTRKFLSNPLLGRKQMVVYVYSSCRFPKSLPVGAVRVICRVYTLGIERCFGEQQT